MEYRAYGILSELDNNSLIEKFFELDSDINLVRFLKGLNVAREHISNLVGGVVLQFKPDGLLITQIPRFVKALDVYFRIEAENPDDDVVLVNSIEFDQLRSAYRNYFSDTSEFLLFLTTGIQALRNDGTEVSYAWRERNIGK